MITLQRWGDDDLEVAVRGNAPELMTYLGGPETPEQVRARAEKYARFAREGTAEMMFVIEAAEAGSAAGDEAFDGGVPGRPRIVGSIGYWPTVEDGDEILEAGWVIFVPRRGFATEAVQAMLAHAAEHSDRRYVHAHPRIDNGPSGALCARAGFELLGEIDFEYPPGHPTHNGDWRYDLAPLRL